MSDEKIVVRGYSLTKKEIRILERVSEERSLFNLSAALRQIIREWNEKNSDGKNNKLVPEGQIELPIKE